MNNESEHETSNQEKPSLFRFTGNKLFDGTVAIAALSSCGYFIIFTYEFGYGSYFGIPNEFIAVSLQKLCWVPGILIFVFGSIIMISELLNPLRKLLSIDSVFFPSFLVGLWLMALMLLWAYATNVWWIALLGLVYPLSDFGWPFIFGDKNLSYRDRFNSAKLVEWDPENLRVKLLDRIGIPFNILLIGVFTFMFVSYWIGYTKARLKEEFLLFEYHSESVINSSFSEIALVSYGEVFVCTSVDSLNVISGDFRLVSKSWLNQNPSTIVRVEKLGRLTTLPYIVETIDTLENSEVSESHDSS